MSTYHIIYVTTKVQNRKKNEHYFSFEKCENARWTMQIERMAGKVKDFIEENQLERVKQGQDYNGYGWSSWVYRYLLTPAKVKELQALIEEKKAEKAKKPVKTQEDINKAWAKRLAMFTGISIEKAMEIAEEKLQAQRDQAGVLIERQMHDRYSERRQKLINQIFRANPLRRIEDKDHAMAILAASYRHNCTDYDALLEENRWEAQMGNMDYDQVRSDARAKVAEEVEEGVKRMVGAI